MHSLLQTSALAVLVAGRLPAARASAADASSAVDSALLVGPHAVNPELDCLLRSLAWEYGQHLGSLPGASPAMLPPFRTLFDALRLSADCGLTPPPPEPRGAGPTVAPRSAARAAATYYADPVHGSDSNAGTLSSPFLTVGRALAASRAGPAPASIVLRGGTFFVPETLELLPADSGLSIAAFPGESATLSGGLPLSNLTWTRADVPPSPPLSPPTTGSLLAWNGSSCVKNPGESHPGVCVPLGTTPDAPACAALCLASGATQANASCTGYTWHDNTTGPWHGWCYGREDGYNHVDGEPGHVSAWRLEPVELWSTVLPAGMPLFDQLFYGASGVRAVRARWPNSNPEIDISPNGYTSASSWLPPAAFPPPVEFHPRSPNRSAYDPFFPSFQWGVNGTVGNFTTGSFWGTTHPPAGDQYRVPSGVVLPPNAPPNASSWDTSGAVLHAFHCGGWGDWAFIIDASTGPPADVNGTLVFSRGGWQEARGCATGGGFFVENIPQLVDAAGEWHYDAETRTLLAAFNASTPPSNTSASSPQYITSHLATILSVSGTSSDPVRAVTLGPNLTFAHTLADFEEPYTVPSGGDWSFCASAAVVISGTEATVVQGCTFTRDGGNGILVSGYNRGVEILGSEFSYTGASGIVIAGLNGSAVTAGAPDFPEGTLVAGNLGREVGVYVKQSGFLYSALSANNTVSSNVFFNGPRAGININDGFAGGHNVTGNLGLNFVRETADHGVLNTWDREPYSWRPWNASELEPLLTHITGNYFVNNYHSVWPIDHDDGSNGYVDAGNVLAWGGSKNYLGFNKAQIGNLYIFPDYSPATLAADHPGFGNGYGTCAVSSAGTAAFPIALRDTWFNNTCLQEKGADLFAFGACRPQDPNDGHIPILANNTYATQDNVYLLRCGNLSWDLAAAQAAGIEIGSRLVAMPTADAIVGAARQLLGLP